jgi:opacity protein-like surface antigen
MKKLAQLVAISLLLLTAAASHAGEGRVYAGGQAGMFLPLESSVTGNFDGASGTLTYNPGAVLAAVGGYEFGNGVRGEGELNLRHLTTDKLLSNGATVAADSDIWTYGFMANLYYDFRTRTAVTPYIGAGVGLAVVDFGRGTSNGTTLWTRDSSVSVAYQGIAGFAVSIGSQTSLDFVYHHYAVPTLHFETLSAQFRGLNLSAGVRHWF